jgi:hypothetical protein
MPTIVGERSADSLQGVWQLRSSSDLELREHSIQVAPNRAGGEEEALADLTIGQSASGELGDLELLRGEVVAEIGRAPSDRLARGPQLPAGTPAPHGCAQGVEEGDALAKRRSRFGGAPVPSQPATE